MWLTEPGVGQEAQQCLSGPQDTLIGVSCGGALEHPGYAALRSRHHFHFFG